MPPLLQRLPELKPQQLDWLGVSYGLTPQLLKFWKRAGYVPLYVRQTTNDLTGEHTCVMLRGMAASENDASKEWLSDFASGRFLCPKATRPSRLTCAFRFPQAVPLASVIQIP